MKSIRNIKINWTLATLFGVILFINYPIWKYDFWPKHDSMFNFFLFHIIYSDLFLNHEFARWLPFGTYGIQIDYWQIFCMSPASYFALFVGWLARIKDALLLFKIGIIFEFITLLFGTYLFSKKIFKTKSAIFFACFISLASTVWLYQVYWNFRIYYLLPLLFYFLIRFFEEEKLKYLWISGTIFFLSLFGNIPYYLFLEAPLILIFFFFLAKKYEFQLFSFKKRNIDFIWFALFLFVAGLYLYGVFHFHDHMHHFSDGRDERTRTATIESFLAYGPKTGLYNYLALIFPSTGDERDHTIYLGLVTLIFLFYALFHTKDFLAVAFGWLSLILFLLSLSDLTFFARAIYQFFLPMRYFRYLGILGGLLRFFLLFIAAYGFEQFLLDLKNRRKEEATQNLFRCGLLTLVIVIFFHLFNIKGSLFSKAWPDFYLFATTVLFFTVLFLLNLKTLRARTAAIFVISMVALDLFSFQNQIFANWPAQNQKNNPAFTNVRTPAFQPERLPEPKGHSDPFLAEMYDFLNKGAAFRINFYVESYNFMQFDPCLPLDPMVYEPQGVWEMTDSLLGTRNPIGSYMVENGSLLSHPKGLTFLRTIGCSVPKLFKTQNVLFAKDFEEEKKLVRETPNINQQIILGGAAASHVPAEFERKEKGIDPAGIEVVKFTFNTLKLNVDVKEPVGIFLYYADSYDPGWKVKIDGKKAALFRANLAFKAVFVPSGKHVIEFYFWPPLRSFVFIGSGLVGFLFCFVILYFFVRLLIFKP